MEGLSLYYDRVASMDDRQLGEHLRSSYTTEENAWPDYLDYVDEWQWHFKESMSRTRKDFIFTTLVVRRQRVKCGTHHHYFTDDPADHHPEAVYFPRTDTFIEPGVCWNVLLQISDDKLQSTRALQSSAQLTMPEIEYVRRLAGIRLISKGITPRQLSYDEFRTKWWGQESEATAHSLLQEQTTISEEMGLLKQSLPPAKPQWVADTNGEVDTILPSHTVANDHGLHAVLLATHNGARILKTINRIRLLSPVQDPIEPQDIAEAIRMCPRCTGDPPATGPTLPGVYYAPPGNGKTTCLNERHFCGVDTDWLVKMSDFQTVIAPFLQLDVAVITNQYHLATNAGEKFFGLFDAAHLRLDPTGKPFTPEHEIQYAVQTYGADLAILLEHNYLTNNLLSLYRCNYIYRLAREKFLPRNPQRLKAYYKHRYTSWLDLAQDICSWVSPRRGKHYQQNRRKRARHKELG